MRILIALFIALSSLPAIAQGTVENPAEKTFAYTLSPVRLEILKGQATPQEQARISEHFAYLQQLTTDGVVILAGRTLTDEPDSFGIVIFRAKSEEAARKIMAGDAAVKAGVMRAKLYPFGVALLGKPTPAVK